MYGMLLFVVLAIFVAGLMVGRTPEYVGKKIEAREVKMAMLAILILPLMILGWTAVAVGAARRPVASMANAGPHGFSEVLYAYQLADRQQRLGLRRPHRQHPLLQHHRWRRDVRRPLLHDRAGDGDGGLAGGEEVDPAVGRHACRPPAACSSAWSSA